jgi:hypothetical protein
MQMLPGQVVRREVEASERIGHALPCSAKIADREGAEDRVEGIGEDESAGVKAPPNIG